MKKAVILDGFTANPGDLDWGEMSSIVDLTIHDRTDSENTIRRIGDAELIMTNKVVIDAKVIDSCSNLKYIGVMATGYNVVDLNAAKAKGIVVTNIPSYSTQSVAQHVFGFILEFASGIGMHNRSVHQGDWARSIDFSYTLYSLQELAGLTVGVIGYGTIGKEVARIAKAFEMRILVVTGHPDADPDLEFTDRETLLSESDFITLHTVLNERTGEMVNEDFLAKMKTSAVLINTGRGGLVNEADLATALQEGAIAGAALDVLSTEPPAADNPLLTAPNCIITPHIAWATQASRARLIATLTGNVRSYLNGKPENRII